MSYIDETIEKVNAIFDRYSDKNDIYASIVNLVKETTKESFKNGIQTARTRQFKPKGQKEKTS